MKTDKNMAKPGLFSPQEAPSTEPEAARDKSVDKQIEELVCALTDPLIVWPGPWMETIPEERRKELPLHRLRHVRLLVASQSDPQLSPPGNMRVRKTP